MVFGGWVGLAILSWRGLVNSAMRTLSLGGVLQGQCTTLPTLTPSIATNHHESARWAGATRSRQATKNVILLIAIIPFVLSFICLFFVFCLSLSLSPFFFGVCLFLNGGQCLSLGPLAEAGPKTYLAASRGFGAPWSFQHADMRRHWRGVLRIFSSRARPTQPLALQCPALERKADGVH